MIIVIAHNKGGVGKTTTAFNLAFELKPHHILDQDIHKGISVLATLRNEQLPYQIHSYRDVRTMLAMLKTSQEAGEDVLIDCGGFDSDITRAAITVADLVIVPASDTPTERIGLSRFDQTLEEISRSSGREITAWLLVCRSHPNRKRFPKLDAVLSRCRHIRRLESVLASRADHHEPHEKGMGVTERVATRHSPAGREIQQLAHEIRELLAEAA